MSLLRSEKAKSISILITGTTGSGKSSICGLVADIFMSHKAIDVFSVNVGEFALANDLCGSYDSARGCHVLNERLLRRALRQFRRDNRESLKSKKIALFLFEYHSAGLFPEQWIDRCYVVRCDTAIVFDRLTERGYTTTKVEENVECEIFGISLEDAHDTFPGKVFEIKGDTKEDLQENVAAIKTWIENQVYAQVNKQYDFDKSFCAARDM